MVKNLTAESYQLLLEVFPCDENAVVQFSKIKDDAKAKNRVFLEIQFTTNNLFVYSSGFFQSK